LSENKPVRVFNHGQVRASLWQNQGKHGPYYTVTLQRSYQEDEKRKYTQSFSLYDLWNVVRVCADAYTFISKEIADAKKESAA
jgi:hypothetical protein